MFWRMPPSVGQTKGISAHQQAREVLVYFYYTPLIFSAIDGQFIVAIKKQQPSIEGLHGMSMSKKNNASGSVCLILLCCG